MLIYRNGRGKTKALRLREVPTNCSRWKFADFQIQNSLHSFDTIAPTELNKSALGKIWSVSE